MTSATYDTGQGPVTLRRVRETTDSIDDPQSDADRAKFLEWAERNKSMLEGLVTGLHFHGKGDDGEYYIRERAEDPPGWLVRTVARDGTISADVEGMFIRFDMKLPTVDPPQPGRN